MLVFVASLCERIVSLSWWSCGAFANAGHTENLVRCHFAGHLWTRNQALPGTQFFQQNPVTYCSWREFGYDSVHPGGPKIGPHLVPYTRRPVSTTNWTAWRLGLKLLARTTIRPKLKAKNKTWISILTRIATFALTLTNFRKTQLPTSIPNIQTSNSIPQPSNTITVAQQPTSTAMTRNILTATATLKHSTTVSHKPLITSSNHRPQSQSQATDTIATIIIQAQASQLDNEFQWLQLIHLESQKLN